MLDPAPKRLVVVYVHVGDAPPEKIAEYLASAKKSLKFDWYDTATVYIPTRHEETRIEIIAIPQ